jgi:hypothetical protein
LTGLTTEPKFLVWNYSPLEFFMPFYRDMLAFGSLCALALSLGFSSAQAQQDLSRCSSIQDSLARLTCFDALSAASSPVSESPEALEEKLHRLVAFTADSIENGPWPHKAKLQMDYEDWQFFTRVRPDRHLGGGDFPLFYETVRVDDCRLTSRRVYLFPAGDIVVTPGTVSANGYRTATRSRETTPRFLSIADSPPNRLYIMTVDLRALDIEKSAPQQLVMKRDEAIEWTVLDGWGLPGMIFSDLGLDAEQFPAPQDRLAIRTQERSSRASLGVAYAEDAPEIWSTFFDLARACQKS